MRNSTFVLVAAVLLTACGNSNGGGSGALPTGVTSTISCEWGAGTCDEYTGTIDPTFASNVKTTCAMHGVAFANGPCPAANQVAGYCDFGTSGGMTNKYRYYAPTYDAASAKVDCLGNGAGVTWVP